METKKSLADTIDGMLGAMEEHLNREPMKCSVSDYIRLVQFRRLLKDEETPREIKITWSETLETDDIDE